MFFWRYANACIVYVLQPSKQLYFHTNLDKHGLTDSPSLCFIFLPMTSNFRSPTLLFFYQPAKFLSTPCSRTSISSIFLELFLTCFLPISNMPYAWQHDVIFNAFCIEEQYLQALRDSLSPIGKLWKCFPCVWLWVRKNTNCLVFKTTLSAPTLLR